MKRINRLEIPITDDPKKAAAWWRAEQERERKWRERAGPILEMVEAILKARDSADDTGGR